MQDITKEFLLAISDRLSGRADCKSVEYIVAIGIEDKALLDKYNIPSGHILDSMNPPDGYFDNIVIFSPYRLVYPNRYRRQEKDKMNILSLISWRFTGLFNGLDDVGNLIVNPGYLTSGIYQYVLSVDGRRRRWERLY